MKTRHISALAKAVALVLVFSLMTPCSAMAATQDMIQPYASSYLTAYNTYICNVGSGKIQIWYEVCATGYMDEVGVLSIRLYESSDNSTWTWVKTFTHEKYSSMLATNDNYHCSYVSYHGTVGKYYKAYVCIWAGKNGSGNTRYMWAKML